jgi:hypothetical protein
MGERAQRGEGARDLDRARERTFQDRHGPNVSIPLDSAPRRVPACAPRSHGRRAPLDTQGGDMTGPAVPTSRASALRSRR